MGNKIAIILQESAIVELTVRKPESPRPLRRWLLEAAKEAMGKGAAHFALFYGGEWALHHCYGNKWNPYFTAEPIKTFPNRHAAGMWMLHKKMH